MGAVDPYLGTLHFEKNRVEFNPLAWWWGVKWFVGIVTHLLCISSHNYYYYLEQLQHCKKLKQVDLDLN